MKFLNALSEPAHALLRMVAGFMFAFHGVQKTFGLWSNHKVELVSQIGLGGLIELIGGAAVMLGIKTRAAAFLCSGTMAVAYVQFHWKFQKGAQFFPAINRGELAVLYCFVFFLLATRGGGRWALRD